ncbi:hypothetical protein AVEN_258225-1 [Araneus ventricosus]|uniref:Uncharacterized protein n=1 Tax=Araneus ventricosus TaxID=182803 RepID=A0A4Y2X5W9_ARAVE|nr:hypothetical protein AVEN_258225-1 [Araneus ventricosus]
MFVVLMVQMMTLKLGSWSCAPGSGSSGFIKGMRPESSEPAVKSRNDINKVFVHSGWKEDFEDSGLAPSSQDISNFLVRRPEVIPAASTVWRRGSITACRQTSSIWMRRGDLVVCQLVSSVQASLKCE